MDRRQEAIAVGLLVVLGAAFQVAVAVRATVPALDTVRFIGIARQIDDSGLPDVVRTTSEEPLFPLAVWGVHRVLVRTAGEFRSAWPTSAQFAAGLSLVLAILPVHLISRRLVGPVAGLLGTALFCALPAVTRLAGDGISDATHLLWLSLAIWAVLVYFDTAYVRADDRQGEAAAEPGNHGKCRPHGSAGASRCPSRTLRPQPRIESTFSTARAQPRIPSGAWLVGAGLAMGLAMLTRREAVVLAVALGATLLAFPLGTSRRRPWPRIALAGACFVLGAAVPLGAYCCLRAGWISWVPPARAKVASAAAEDAALGSLAGVATPDADPLWRLADGRPMSFAPKDSTTSRRRRGWLAGLALLGEELAVAFGYVPAALAVLGFWQFTGRRARAIDGFARAFFALFLTSVCLFAVREGYVSARHLLPLVVVGIGCAGHGVLVVGGALSRRKAAWCLPLLNERAACAAVLLVAVLFCLFEGARPLHANQTGHRLAADWLAGPSRATGAVVDTRGWTGLYSGHPTFGYERARRLVASGELAYLVLEDRELGRKSRRGRTLRFLLALAADKVAGFPPPGHAAAGPRVSIYRWQPERFASWVERNRQRLACREG